MRKLALIAALALLSGCARDIQNKDAVRAAVIDYLKQRESQLGLKADAFNVEVSTLSFGSNDARATVVFTPKIGGGGMHMDYVLDRKGNKWVVRGRTENGTNPHGAEGVPQLPPNHPPVGQPK